MKTKIIQIGNSRGIRIPKLLLEESGLQEEVELSVREEQIIISAVNKPRYGWAEAFKRIAGSEHDKLLDAKQLEKSNEWDEEEWRW